MKLVKFILIVLEIILALYNAFSQTTTAGFRVGANYFTIHNELIEDNAMHTAGIDLAIPVEFKISPLFSIQPELHFSQKGAKFESIQEGKDLAVEVKTNYLELPLILKANYGTERVKYYLFAAPSIGYATNRFIAEKTGATDKVIENIDFIKEGATQSQRFELSALVGVGTSLKAGVGAIVIDIRYSFGLTDNTKLNKERPSSFGKTTNRGCTLSAGYMMPIGS